MSRESRGGGEEAPRASELDEILKLASERHASDVHLQAGLPPVLRILTRLVPLEAAALDGAAAERLIFPIMAAGAAVTGAGACIRHIQMGKMNLKVVVGLGLGGIPAVLVAAFIVKTMPLELLRWLVIVVVLYAAAIMLRAAHVGRGADILTPEEVPATS